MSIVAYTDPIQYTQVPITDIATSVVVPVESAGPAVPWYRLVKRARKGRKGKSPNVQHSPTSTNQKRKKKPKTPKQNEPPHPLDRQNGFKKKTQKPQEPKKPSTLDSIKNHIGNAGSATASVLKEPAKQIGGAALDAGTNVAVNTVHGLAQPLSDALVKKLGGTPQSQQYGQYGNGYSNNYSNNYDNGMGSGMGQGADDSMDDSVDDGQPLEDEQNEEVGAEELGNDPSAQPTDPTDPNAIQPTGQTAGQPTGQPQAATQRRR